MMPSTMLIFFLCISIVTYIGVLFLDICVQHNPFTNNDSIAVCSILIVIETKHDILFMLQMYGMHIWCKSKA